MAHMPDDDGAYDYGYALAEHPEYGVDAQLQPHTHPDHVQGAGEERAPPGPPEHHSMMTHGVRNDVYAAPMAAGPPARAQGAPMTHGVPMHTQAVGEVVPTGRHNLGASLLAVGVGGAVGGRYGGWAGAGAGVLFAGAALNALRAFSAYKDGSEAGDKEGRVSALYSIVGAGGGALLWSKYATKRMAHNPGSSRRAPPESPFGDPCGIRPVGP